MAKLNSKQKFDKVFAKLNDLDQKFNNLRHFVLETVPQGTIPNVEEAKEDFQAKIAHELAEHKLKMIRIILEQN